MFRLIGFWESSGDSAISGTRLKSHTRPFHDYFTRAVKLELFGKPNYILVDMDMDTGYLDNAHFSLEKIVDSQRSLEKFVGSQRVMLHEEIIKKR